LAGDGVSATFEDCRHAARRLLGDAADQIRAGDWQPLPTKAQRDAVRRAMRAIDEAVDALDEAVHMDTIDLDEDDR
jgi:hypothetical protein